MSRIQKDILTCIDPEPRPKTEDPRTFKQVDLPFHGRAVRSDDKYLPSLSMDPTSSDRWVGLFGRTLYTKDYSDLKFVCTQLLFVWDGQLFPPHKMDYEPIFILQRLKSGKEHVVYVFDKLHYKTSDIIVYNGRYPPVLKYKWWWRSFIEVKNPKKICEIKSANLSPFDILHPSIKITQSGLEAVLSGIPPIHIEIEPMYDSYLFHWWNKKKYKEISILGRKFRFLSGGKLTIEEKLKDPFEMWASGKFYNPHPLPLLEDLATRITMPLCYSVILSDSLNETLGRIWNDFLNPKEGNLRDIVSSRIFGDILGYIAFLLLLDYYRLLRIDEFKGHLLEIFEKYSDKLTIEMYIQKIQGSEEFRELKDHLLREMRFQRMRPSETTKAYFQGLKDQILKDRDLLFDLKNWLRQSDYWLNFSPKQRDDVETNLVVIEGKFPRSNNDF